MGLFGSKTHRRTATYGKAETNALQPGLFDAWRRLLAGGGVPPQLSDEINRAYATAQADMAKAGYSPEVTAAIRGNMGRRGDISGDLLKGAVGVRGQNRMLDATGQMGGYLGALTSQRPQYSFDSSTPWGDFWGGIGTLQKPAAMAMAVLQTRPDALANMAGPGAGAPVGGGQSFASAYDPNKFRLQGLPSFAGAPAVIGHDIFDPSKFRLQGLPSFAGAPAVIGHDIFDPNKFRLQGLPFF